MRERECQAPVHHPDCPCPRCTRDNCRGCRVPTDDHTTGRAIGKLLGINRKEINRTENHEILSGPCHREKDKLTPAYLEQLRYQRNGGYIGLGEHIPIGINDEGVSNSYRR